MSEGQVMIVTRPPSGRKRSGGGYIGRSKRKPPSAFLVAMGKKYRTKGRLSGGRPRRELQNLDQSGPKLSSRDRAVAEWLAGPEAKTAVEIGLAFGINADAARCVVTRVRRLGGREYTVTNENEGRLPARYRTLRGELQNPDQSPRKLSSRERQIAEALATPAGLTCAELVALMGTTPHSIHCTISRIRHHGLPEYRLTSGPGPDGTYQYRTEKRGDGDHVE